MTLLLGILIGIVTSIAGNLLTPFMRPFWQKFRSMQERGYRAQVQQRIRVLEADLERLNRLKASDRDLYLYLFRWVLGIISIFVVAVTCGIIGFANSQPGLLTTSVVLDYRLD